MVALLVLFRARLMWTSWHRLVCLDRSSRRRKKRPKEREGLPGWMFVFKPDDRGRRRAGPGVGADFLVRLRPETREENTHPEQVRLKADPALSPEDANKPRANLGSVFRQREEKRSRAGGWLSLGNPALSFLCVLCVCGLSLLMKWQQ